MSSTKKIAPRLVLKENHPTAVKIAKLCELADELGISISFYHQRVLVTDEGRDKNLPPLFLEDIEENHHFESFPFETEYKMVYANPEFLAQEKREQYERDVLRNEERRIFVEQEEIRAKAAAEVRAKELEAAERLMLVKLKEKYKDE